MNSDPIHEYLLACRALNEFCSQNGWVDNDSIKYDVLHHYDDAIVIAVTFVETIMEGSGCIAGCMPCYGRMMLRIDGDGRVIDARKIE